MSPGHGRGLAAEIGRFVRANLSSTVASALEYVLVTGLLVVGVHYLIGATVGAVSGAITDFSLKRHWAFPRANSGRLSHQSARYLFVSALSLVLNLALSYALVDGLHLPKVPSVIGASLVVGFAWNYPMHRLFVFRTHHHAHAEAPVSTGTEPQRGET